MICIKDWPSWKFNAFTGIMMIFPPVWIVFSLPFDTKYHKTPWIKFLGSLTSHMYFMFFQILTSCIPIYPIFRCSHAGVNPPHYSINLGSL